MVLYIYIIYMFVLVKEQNFCGIVGGSRYGPEPLVPLKRPGRGSAELGYRRMSRS